MTRKFRVKGSFYTDIELDIPENSLHDIEDLIETELNKGYACEDLQYEIEKEILGGECSD